jgi:excisionase family DNA binding protein
MNKQETADFLGVSLRAVERYTSQSKLTVAYVRGKTRDIADYNEAEVRKLKEEMENPTPRPAASQNALITTGSKQLAALPGAYLADFAGMIAAAMETRAQPETIIELANKPLLTRREASRYTGLSANILKDAVASGKLKEKLLGKAYRIKRADLDNYIKKL